jgi:hypothetical protein
VLVVLKCSVALLYSKRYELFVVFSKHLVNIKFSQELLNKMKELIDIEEKLGGLSCIILKRIRSLRKFDVH